MWTIEPRPLLPRELPSQDARRSPIVGAPPVSVAIGAPGARDEVRAYANRIAQAWDDFESKDLSPWFEALANPASSTPPGKLKEAGVLAQKIRADRADFEAYRTKIAGFDPLGPSPSEAWQELYLHELALKKDRDAFRSYTGSIKSPEPGALEGPGGISPIDAGGVAGGIMEALKPLAWGVGLLGAGLILSSAVRGVKG